MFELKEGINVHVLHTEKFKTVSIQFRFKAPLQANDITRRALLANMMNINSLHFPTQIDLSKRLSFLYGANFFTDVTRYGNTHVFSLNIDCIDEKLISETGIIDQTMDFMYQVLFFPNVFNGRFHEPTFFREVEKLRDEYLSREEDKAVYADDKLNELYYDAPEQKMIGYGKLSDLKSMTSADLYDTYLRMINEDQLDVYVTGNVSENEVRKLLERFDFSSRKRVKWDPFHYRNKTGTIRKKKETQKINQTILTMAFWTPIYYQNEYYFTGLVFDGIFGSMPHSGLFMTIRENENLAYAISSDVDAYRGMLTVEAGIESKDVRKVTDLIKKELKNIIDGTFTEEDMLQTKEILKSDICQFADSPYSMIEKDYSLSLVGRDDLPVNDWMKKIESVSREDIMELAALIELEAIFTLIGENN